MFHQETDSILKKMIVIQIAKTFLALHKTESFMAAITLFISEQAERRRLTLCFLELNLIFPYQIHVGPPSDPGPQVFRNTIFSIIHHFSYACFVQATSILSSMFM
jgi:hypothetical protein